MKQIFDEKEVLSKVNMDFIHKGWTLGFTEGSNLNQSTLEANSSLYQRLRELVEC